MVNTRYKGPFVPLSTASKLVAIFALLIDLSDMPTQGLSFKMSPSVSARFQFRSEVIRSELIPLLYKAPDPQHS